MLDLRRTAKTIRQNLGADELVSELCLNHKVMGVQGTYDRHQFFNKRMEALQGCADYLTECENESFKLEVKKT